MTTMTRLNKGIATLLSVVILLSLVSYANAEPVTQEMAQRAAHSFLLKEQAAAPTVATKTSDEFEASSMLPQILDQIRKVTLPEEAYSVDIDQDVSYAAQKQEKASAGQAVETSARFGVSYEPQRGTALKGKREDVLQKSNRLRVLITLDMKRFIDDLAQAKQVAVSEETLDGRKHYRLAEQTVPGEATCVLVVDAERSSVSRLMVMIGDELFLEAKLSNVLVEGRYWLPKRVEITHPHDGSTAVQDYGAYTVKNRPPEP